MASKNDSDQKAGNAVEFYRVMTDSLFLTNISDHAVGETLLLGVPTPGPGQAWECKAPFWPATLLSEDKCTGSSQHKQSYCSFQSIKIIINDRKLQH